ncbi:acetolactate synthase 2 catalytic subunit [Thioalkalivibrio sp. XN279]|uniref:acetolactate synthase 2 catalytic subunit n=1 Tax=Thioalkalivibrio sp. XN279 TaxID=2714953 RepID=UPI00140A7641|nr:acetolactate synthase 2 catalytic subunit [Thioalkalivibrio sp. XN279]NHA14883.1 acetolactate synthase 2 catalytic subunit [Thioalkalivibrio sp. XN279]
MSAKGAELVVRALEQQGVEIIFGYPGGAIMPVYDALLNSSIKHILARHEQGAALAADAYARVTGRPAVCMATSGPGATNLVTGIANAFMDSVPLVIITGQVPTTVMGTDAFQEVDVFGITMPIVKHSFIVRRAEDIPKTIALAFQIASEGRPGPVLVDLPKDVTNAVPAITPIYETRRQKRQSPDPEQVEMARELILAAQRPVLYGGGGIPIAGAVDAFRAYAQASGIPVVTTLKGIGSVSTRDENFLGMLGMHGNRAANRAIQESDLLICVGARFDDRATGKLDGFAPKASVIHMDADPSEIGKLRFADAGLLGDLAESLGAMPTGLSIEPWRQWCAERKVEHAWRYDAPGDYIYVPHMLRRLTEEAPDVTIACDVGQHQMWVAQHCHFDRPEQHLTSAGLGTMGYGIPAGIGACLARPGARVVTVSGDGSIMMNIQELATIRRYGLDLKILLVDNSSLGMVRQWQQLFHQERYSEVDLSDNPDFVEVARSFGIPGFRITRRDEVEGAIRRLLETEGPLLAHVCIDPKSNVWPLVPPGQSNDVMMEELSA